MSRIGDFFVHCTDISLMRTFYSDILKLDESFYSEEYKHLVYKLSVSPEITMVIMESVEAQSNTKWDNGPVFREGSGYGLSFTLRVEDMDEFRTIVEAIRGNYDHFYPTPQWVGYWSFMVKDPMGLSIDVYHELKDKPENTPIWK